MSSFTSFLLFLTSSFAFGFCGTSEDGTIPVTNSSIACGTDQPLVITESYGFLQSPGFDNFRFYPSDSSCSWTLQAPEGKVIVLRKQEFSLNIICDSEALEIYEDGKMVDRYCGYWIPPVYKSRTNKVHLKFLGSKRPRTVGFQIYFEHSLPTVKCEDDEISCRHKTKCVHKRLACDDVDDCGDGTDEENCELQKTTAECGIPKIKPVLGNDRIVGGRDAIPGSWPWQVSLRLIDKVPPFSHWCGGALINRQWAITAAHCFKNGLLDTERWNVFLGKHFKLIPENSEQIRYIKSIHVHPDYKGFEAKLSDPWLMRKSHDIALVELNAPVNITDSIIPVCLPPKEKDLDPGNLCYVTGWGETYSTGFEYVLKQAAVPVVSRETCRKWYRFFPIADTMICAGYEAGGHDACQGDSGGPLVYLENKETWKLAGIVSTGGICADEQQPGIYTAVAPHVEWIDKAVKPTPKA